MITVMGATGNVGRKIVHRLLEAGEPVRAIGRNPRALAELAAAGAEPHAGDAADVAFLAAALRSRDWMGGEVRELLGPRDLSYTEATRILGAAMGRPDLRYVQLSGDEMAAALVQAGFTPDAAALHVEMGNAITAGRATAQKGRTPQTTTPTRFEDVVSELLEEAS